MLSPRQKKILRDIWLNLPRNLLVIGAIAIGIFSVSFILNANSILTREIETNLNVTNPASAILWMDNVDSAALAIARNFPAIADAEVARNTIRGRVQVSPDRWEIFLFEVVDDFNSQRINQFFPESGAWPPEVGQVLVERSSLPVIKAALGDRITVKTLTGRPQELTLAGSVWDPNQEPAWINNVVFGYITPDTFKLLNDSAVPNTLLRIMVNDSIQDRPHIRDVAAGLALALQQQGHPVNRVEVPEVGKNIQTNRVNSILYLLGAFGFLCLLLSALITTTLISSLMSRQIRQIGVLKAVGAGTRQIMTMYFGSVLLLSTAALIIALPLGILAGRAFAFPVLNMLNLNVTNTAIPLWTYLVQISLGILIPLAAAAFPVYQGSRTTVREAINDNGNKLNNFGAKGLEKLLRNIRGLPIALILAQRNIFRRRIRLILAVIMLAAGGATFITALGSAASWNQTIDNTMSGMQYDIEIRFAQPYPTLAIENTIRSVPGVADVEVWGYSMSNIFPKYRDGTYGGPLALQSPPAGSTLIHPGIIAGRWLLPGDTNSLVLDTNFIAAAQRQGTPVNIGDDFILNIDGLDTTWRITGIVDKIGVQTAAYADYEYFQKILQQPGLAAGARVVTVGHAAAFQKSVSQGLEQTLAANGLNVFTILGLTATRQILVNHVVLITVLLLIMSILVAAVGCLGLASIMSLNTLERIREIGVMRAVGASTSTILQVVISEGIAIGILSWILAVIIAIPLTHIVAGQAGQFIFPQVMQIVIPPWSIALWLGIIIVITVLASLYPAWRAANSVIREVLTAE
jgi:putative ABC transport system permease protein